MILAKTTAAVAFAAMAIASSASAATVSFQGSADGTDFSISFSDDIANQINVEVTSTANPNQADLFGLGFDWVGTPAPTAGDFNFVSSNTGEGITQICLGTLSCGGGLNFNGTGVSAFDYIVRMGDQGTPLGYLENFKFYISSALTIDEFLGDSFGIRAQSTGASGQGSIKLVSFDRVPEVPLPAAGFLLIGALGGLMGLRRRRKPA